MALPMALLDGPLFSQPQDISVHPRASLSRPGTLSLRPRNQDIAVLLNAFDFRRSPGYGSGTTSLGSSSSGHSHASHFSAPRHRSGARAQGTVVFSTPRHRGEAREVRVPGAVMRPFSRAKSEARAATCLWGATYLSRERYTSLREVHQQCTLWGRVARDVAGAASKHGLLLVDWWFGMQGFPRAFCGITANRGLLWGIGGLGCRESRGLVGLMSVFVGVFSMFSGCPPPISQETISNIA